MFNTGVDKNTCDKEFEKNSPNFKLIAELIVDLSQDNCSLKDLLTFDFQTAKSQYKVVRLKQAIKELKKPVYLKNNNNLENINSNTMPTDISTINRELHFQKMALSSLAREQILETQLKTLLTAISASLPEEYVKAILETYNKLQESTNETLKLEL